MDTVLYTSHSRALTLLHSEVEAATERQREVFAGTAGSVLERENATGFRFYAHQFYGPDGKKKEKYLAGPVGTVEADKAAESLRLRIAETKGLVPTLRLLGREGFAITDPKTLATVATLHNRGLFRAGAVLVGSHAYGVILNRLGARAAAWTTTDIDIARGERLSGGRVDLLATLRESGIDFVEVPELDRKRPATSFKEPGRSGLVVDLLATTNQDRPILVEVPELHAHAAGLPDLAYLLEETQPGALLGREGSCAVRVPVPERFAVHKVLVSSRRRRNPKSEKDLLQAAVLSAILAESQSGALESAIESLRPRARKSFEESARRLLPLLSRHPRAIEALAIGP